MPHLKFSPKVSKVVELALGVMLINHISNVLFYIPSIIICYVFFFFFNKIIKFFFNKKIDS